MNRHFEAWKDITNNPYSTIYVNNKQLRTPGTSTIESFDYNTLEIINIQKLC